MIQQKISSLLLCICVLMAGELVARNVCLVKEYMDNKEPLYYLIFIIGTESSKLHIESKAKWYIERKSQLGSKVIQHSYNKVFLRSGSPPVGLDHFGPKDPLTVKQPFHGDHIQDILHIIYFHYDS